MQNLHPLKYLSPSIEFSWLPLDTRERCHALLERICPSQFDGSFPGYFSHGSSTYVDIEPFKPVDARFFLPLKNISRSGTRVQFSRRAVKLHILRLATVETYQDLNYCRRHKAGRKWTRCIYRQDRLHVQNLRTIKSQLSNVDQNKTLYTARYEIRSRQTYVW